MKLAASNFSGDTTPMWMNTNIYKPVGASLPLSTEVCVVGSGIAGLMTAYFCAPEGRSVCVLDCGPLLGGQSGRTTAHLSYVLDERFQHLIRNFGEERTTRLMESHQIAIDKIERIVHQEKIDCDFSREKGILFLSPDKSLELLEKEIDACYRIGIQDVEMLNDFEKSGLGPCLKFNSQAQFHPVKFMSGLLEALEKMSVTIHPYVRVEEIHDGEPCEVKTSRGTSIKAQHVVVATNTPINDRFAIHTKQAPYRTYAIAAPIPKGSLPRALYWDTAEPYHYIRLQQMEGSDFDMAIVGGEDHKTGQDLDAEHRFKELEKWAKEKIPGFKNVNHRWSGQVWEPIDQVAFIGRNPGEKRVFVSTGSAGLGMTYGVITGLLLTDLIHDRKNPWESLFDPSRKPFGSTLEFLKENLNVADQYLDYFRGSDVDGVKSIDKDEGAVIQDGLHKVAVYRDEVGQLRQFSAVCPHLGGVVHWNNAEKSWDCPCHGSRFNTKGEAITGPANSSLKAWKQNIESAEQVSVTTQPALPNLPENDLSI